MITHKLEVNGVDWTDRLISANVQFQADAGSSGMEFEVTGSLEDFDDAPIRLWLGEENDLVPYFKGRVQGPNDDDRLDRAKANAFGPFRNMSTQKLGTSETFIGRTLEWVIFECARRAGHDNGEILVINGHKYRVQQGEQFPFDNDMGDVLNTLMEKAEFVGVDQPEGRRVFRPKPKPGSNKKFKTTLNPDEYWELDIAPKEDSDYSKVVVYRNGDNSIPQFKAERDVISQKFFQPPKLRMYVVSDFEGSPQEAEEEAYRLADELRAGTNSFSMNIDFDETYQLYDGFKIIRIKKEEQRTYACFLDEGITVNYSPGNPAWMSLSGSCFEMKHYRENIQEAEQRVMISSGILARPPDNI
jgi:hypothetical protein